MFQRFRNRRRNRAIIEALYGALVEEARAPVVYTDCAVPDTVMGRFEALSIHVFLLLRRCRGETVLAPIGQEVVDRFVTDVEHSIRELGVGDQSVPKRMRKLAGIFYERVAAYESAFEAEDGDRVARLAEALRGRALPQAASDTAATVLAHHMIEVAAAFDGIGADAILSGRLENEARA